MGGNISCKLAICKEKTESRKEGRKKKQSLRRQKVKLCAVLSEKEELRRRPSTSARVHSTELKHTCARIAYSSADETREEQHTRAPKLLLDPHPTRNVILQKANAAAAAGGCGARRTASVVARPDGTGRRPGGRDGERGIGGRGEQGRRVSSPVDGVGGDLTASAPRSLLPPPLSPGEEEEAPFVSFACVCALRLACAFVRVWVPPRCA